jgi:hypothetical protein
MRGANAGTVFDANMASADDVSSNQKNGGRRRSSDDEEDSTPEQEDGKEELDNPALLLMEAKYKVNICRSADNDNAG